MLVATLHCVAELGYPATTVADIVSRAAVSRSTFYDQFADKEACFIAAYDFAMQHALASMNATAQAQAPQTWRERVRNDLTTYLDVLADEPALATTLHVEVLAAGPAALEHRAELLGVLASRIANLGELAQRADSAVRDLPPAVFALFTGGLDELIRDRLRTDSSTALHALAEPLLEATYAMFGA
ncbi:MAG TPA: helix-turn-helix domain-containing protein [Solirubrobacteraceae bacterium]|nr:helix-turn-helix domain-containing protein [Solirubrobacteraceae bacterium]